MLLFAEPLSQTTQFDQLKLAASLLSQELKNTHWIGEGRLKYFQKEDCAKLMPVYGNCFGNNPQSPYGFSLVPQAPGELRDSVYKPLATALGGDSSFWPIFRMRSNEAHIVFSITPPKAVYFGHRMYLYSSKSLNLLDGSLMGSIPALSFVFNKSLDPGRRDILATLGSTINNFNIATGRSPFDAPSVTISTADQNVAQELKVLIEAKLKKVGLPQNIINIDPIPESLVKLGYGTSADDFIFLNRYAFPEDPVAATAYLANPSALVLRVVPNQLPSRIYEKFPLNIPDRKAGWNEQHLAPVRQALADSIEKTFGPQFKNIERVQGFKYSVFRGYKCARWGYGCAFDNEDTTYTSVLPRPVRTGDLVAIVGINHNEAQSADGLFKGMATYTSVSLYNFSKFLGIEGKSNNELKGTTIPYLSGIADANYRQMAETQLFALFLSRNCNGLNGCINIPVGELGAEEHEDISVINRAYIRPGTSRGPDYSEIEAEEFIYFRK